MKKRNMYFKIGFIILMVGLLMTVSCSKKKPGIGTMIDQQTGTESSQQIGTEDTITEEELAAQQLREEEKKRKAILAKEAARKRFLNSDIYFNFDDATLTSNARKMLKQKVEWLRANSDVKAVIEGHCDERGTEEYNIALGQQRAQSIKTFLMNSGLSGSRLKMISYGEERPVDSGSNETAWARNRRGHFRIE